jgi:serine/threonine protein phosphatase PrpC
MSKKARKNNQQKLKVKGGKHPMSQNNKNQGQTIVGAAVNAVGGAVNSAISTITGKPVAVTIKGIEKLHLNSDESSDEYRRFYDSSIDWTAFRNQSVEEIKKYGIRYYGNYKYPNSLGANYHYAQFEKFEINDTIQMNEAKCNDCGIQLLDGLSNPIVCHPCVAKKVEENRRNLNSSMDKQKQNSKNGPPSLSWDQKKDGWKKYTIQGGDNEDISGNGSYYSQGSGKNTSYSNAPPPKINLPVANLQELGKRRTSLADVNTIAVNPSPNEKGISPAVTRRDLTQSLANLQGINPAAIVPDSMELDLSGGYSESNIVSFDLYKEREWVSPLPDADGLSSEDWFASYSQMRNIDPPKVSFGEKMPPKPISLDSMNISESYTKIGTTHRRNEDSLLNIETDKYKASIVSDGCSSGNRSDIGSMIHCAAFERFVNDISAEDNELSNNTLSKYLAHIVVLKEQYNNVFAGSEQYKLNDESLLATIVMNLIPKNGDRFYLTMIGDGVILLRDRNNPDKWDYIRVDYENNAPAYPIYLVEKDNQEAYRKQIGEPIANIERGWITLSDKQTDYYNEPEKKTGFAPHMFNYSKDKYDLCIMATDGLESCVAKSKEGVSMDINWMLLFLEIGNFKNFGHGFFDRRVSMALRSLGAEHKDDLSLTIMNITKTIK